MVRLFTEKTKKKNETKSNVTLTPKLVYHFKMKQYVIYELYRMDRFHFDVIITLSFSIYVTHFTKSIPYLHEQKK